MVKPKPADILFIMHYGNWISKVISKCMKSKWSHSAIVLEDTSHRTFLVETTNKEVSISSLDKYLKNPNVSFELWRKEDLTDFQRRVIAKTALDDLYETPYGYLQLLGFLISIVAKKIGWNIEQPFKCGIVCSGVVAYAYVKNLCAHSRKWSFDPKSIHTEDLYRLIQKDGFNKIYEHKKSKTQSEQP